MSTAKYPLGMKPTPASGYNQKSSASDQYITWKGEGLSKHQLELQLVDTSFD